MQPILISDTELTKTMKIGFVGLGHMGGNMAARFLAARYTVYGESRDRRDAQDLVHEGLNWRGTPREVADAADVLFTSLPDDGVLETVASGPDGNPCGPCPWEDLGRRQHRQPRHQQQARGARARPRRDHA